ncbi:MAG: ATP-binding protein [Bacilli bacterium]
MFDIFNPQVSVVAKGLEGKRIMIYGGNNLGKTKQSTRMKKPFYLPFEKGVNAISGVSFVPINTWADFKKVNKQLTSLGTVGKAKEIYSTIIFDEVEASAKYCQRYINSLYGVSRLKDGNDGFGLWKEYETEYWEEINKLTGAGYTVVFIAHKTENKDGFILPKGDKRALEPIIDNCDIVVYLESNGVDEDGKVINSSGYLAQTDKFFARSRFDYIETKIENFTAEKLEEVIIKAIETQEEVEGVKAVTFQEQKTIFESQKISYEELMENIGEAGGKLIDANKSDLLVELVEKHLGKGKKVSECTKMQIEVMTVIYDDLADKIQELGL